MLTLIIFFLILSVLVLIHEFGHFYTAKKFGIKVEEFGFGLPPKLFGKKIGETEYTYNALPFGGFVRLYGEETPEDPNGEVAHSPFSFAAKSPLKRAIVLVAGVTMNVILGVSLYYIFFLFTNFKSLTLPLMGDYNFRFGQTEKVNTVISGFSQDSLAEKAGLQSGDAVIEVNNVPVYTLQNLKDQLADKPNQKVRLLVMNVVDLKKPIRTVEVQTIANEKGEGILGAYLMEAVTLSYNDSKLTAGFAHAYNVLAYSGATFKQLVSQSVSTRDVTPVSSSVSGPVGIFNVVGSILNYGGSQAVLGLIDLTALLSLSLAFINIMPFPALDGGRLVFVTIEALTKKKVSAHFENNLHKWGMIFLLSLIAIVTIKDITSIFTS